MGGAWAKANEGLRTMARRCELTGKDVLVGNNVSHANNKNKRRFLPNIQKQSLRSEILGQDVRFRIAVASMRTVEKQGGLDNFLMAAKDADLSMKARRLKKAISKAAAKSA